MATKPGTMSSDAKADEAVKESFPASDPVAVTGTRGARAVPVEEMLGESAQVPASAITLRRSFATAEEAKLALEGLVRDGPIDRRLAEISGEGSAELVIQVAANDQDRIRKLLDAT